MLGPPGKNASHRAAQRAAAQRREMVKGYWYEEQRQRNQLVQYCLCGAKKIRAMKNGRSTTEFYCPNRHRPDHQPGAAYGRQFLVYKPGD